MCPLKNFTMAFYNMDHSPYQLESKKKQTSGAITVPLVLNRLWHEIFFLHFLVDVFKIRNNRS